MVAGIETPAQLEAEEAWYAMRAEVESLTRPVEVQWCNCATQARKDAYINDDFIPF